MNNNGSITFNHLVQLGIRENIPHAGTPLYLEFDMEKGHRISGAPVARAHWEDNTNNEYQFGGIVTDVQPPQAAANAVRHPEHATYKYALICTCIHGLVSAHISTDSNPPLRTTLVLFKAAPPHLEVAAPYPPPLPARKIPNAVLFVPLLP